MDKLPQTNLGATDAVAVLAFQPAPAPRDEHGALQNMVLLAWSGHVRVLHGEYLYGQQCLESAVDVLLGLLRRYGGGALRHIQSPNPRRGLEALAPALAHELLGILLGTVDMPEVRL